MNFFGAVIIYTSTSIVSSTYTKLAAYPTFGWFQKIIIFILTIQTNCIFIIIIFRFSCSLLFLLIVYLSWGLLRLDIFFSFFKFFSSFYRYMLHFLNALVVVDIVAAWIYAFPNISLIWNTVTTRPGSTGPKKHGHNMYYVASCSEVKSKEL